nr:MAG: capsid protein [Cressdnaviricota sp.]
MPTAISGSYRHPHGHEFHARVLHDSGNGGAGGVGNEISKYRTEKMSYVHRGQKKKIDKLKKFRSKIERALATEAPVQTFISAYGNTATTSAGALGTVFEVYPLLSWNGGPGAQQLEAWQLCTDIFNYSLSSVVAPGHVLTMPMGKYIMESASMDLMVKNTGSFGVMLDLYWCECRKDSNVTTINSLVGPSFATDLSPTAPPRPASLFEFRDWTEHFLIKSKETVYLDAGNFLEKRFSYGGRRHIDGELLGPTANYIGCVKAGYTKCLVIGQTSMITTNSSNVLQGNATQVEYGVVKRFKGRAGVESFGPSALASL